MHLSPRRWSAIALIPLAFLAGRPVAAEFLPGQPRILPVTTALDGAQPRLVAVQGQGTVEAVPDIVDVTAGVVIRAKTARAAVNQNSAAMARLLATLRRAGIAEKDIRTSGFSVSPFYEPAQRNRPREIAGYRAGNEVAVTIRDIRKVGEVLDQMVGAGSNRINGVRFDVSNRDALMDEARRRAVADAKRRAKLLATAAGAVIGRVLAIHETGIRLPQPRMLSAAAMRESSAVPIEPGTQEIIATVSVQYELK